MQKSIDHYSPALGQLSAICDQILLNFLFLLSCLPVFTIGAAICGMCYVNGKRVRGDESPVWRNYLTGFRENFKSATIFWLLFLAIFGLVFLDWQILPILLPGFYKIPQTILALGLFFLTLCSFYLFPILTRFVCTPKQAAKSAVLMVFGHFPTTLALLALHAILPLIALFSELAFLYAACMYLIFGFSLTNLAASYLLRNVMSRYENI